MAPQDTNIGVEILHRRNALLLKRDRLQRLNAVITASMEEHCCPVKSRTDSSG
jgi:hypothetical protein